MPNEARLKAWMRVAAVEVADLADARIVVVRAVRVRAAHRADRDVLEDGEGAELGRGGRHAGVARASVRITLPLCQRFSDCGTLRARRRSCSRRSRRLPAIASAISARQTSRPRSRRR